MKFDLDAALTAAIVTVACVVLLQFAREGPEQPAAGARLDTLAAEVGDHARALSALQTELRDLRRQLSAASLAATASGVPSNEVSVAADISARLAAVEQSLAGLSASKSESLDQRREQFAQRLRDRTTSPAAMTATAGYAAAEEEYNQDSGKPLAQYTDAIEETLHGVDSIELQGLECRESICKITYRPSALLTPQERSDAASALADQLMFGINGQSVELTYATDAHGQNLVYLKVN